MTTCEASVLMERREAIATVTLSRPGRRNGVNMVSAETLQLRDYVEIESARHLHGMKGSAFE
jgi:enoyl-CoA hydratase/carnithine racemase